MTDVVRTVEAMRLATAEARARGLRIGLVPTMGALHRGHVRLIEECRRLAGAVAVSIFVNPTQFGPNEDYARYPRPLEDDLASCREAGADWVFVPSVETMYPTGPGAAFVEVPGPSARWEGASRPGHFRGVATVVLKLFAIVRPDLAVFGRKDYQQQVVVRRMARDLHLPVEIVTVPTVREPDGLALSSRNRYLDPAERRAALVLYRALENARRTVAEGEQDVERVRQILRQTLESEPGARIDYADIVDGEDLEPLDRLGPTRKAVALVAARVGATRLIDNAPLFG